MKDLGRQILHDIKEYYPLGVPADSPEYENSEERNRWNIRLTASRQPAVAERWADFCNGLVKTSKETAGGIVGSIRYAQDWTPCYGVSFLIKREKVNAITHRRALHVEISALGPYYTIYGLEEVWIEGNEDNFVSFPPVVFISPYGPYKDVFGFVRSELSTHYPELIFVPSPILRHRIQRLSIDGAENREGANIYQALFRHEDVLDNRCSGDSHYT